jgi:hypothetical protein
MKRRLFLFWDGQRQILWWRCHVKRSRTAVAGILGLSLLFWCGSYAAAQEKQDDQALEQQKLPVAHEEAPGAVTGTATLGVFSQYLFRGYELSKSSVVFQPGLTASYNGFSASLWGNIDSREHGTQNFVPDRDRKRSFNETDLTLSYTKTLGKVGLTGGWIYYGTKYADETQELFGTVAYDMVGKPAISVYRDVDRYPGTYFNFSLAHSIKLGRDVTLDLGASAGYLWGDGSYWKTFDPATGDRTGSKYQAFHDGKLQAGLTIPIAKKVTLVPVIQYWFPLSGKAKRHWGDDSYNPNGYLRSLVVGGASINYNF